MILMKGAWVMKIKKIIIALSAAVMITAVCGLVFGFYIDEFTYKLRCIDCIISGYREDINVQKGFRSLSRKIKEQATGNDGGMFCVPEAFAGDEESLSAFSLINGKFSPVQNQIYGIIYENDNIYFMFEEGEYIFVYSDRGEFDPVPSGSCYFRYRLDENMCLLIKCA